MNTLIIILIVVSVAVLATNVLLLMNYSGQKKTGRKTKETNNPGYSLKYTKQQFTNHS